MPALEETNLLFSYGTLQSEDVQVATFGRRLGGRSDALLGYAVTSIPIKDPKVALQTGQSHYRNIQLTGNDSDVVEGTVFTVTAKELEEADVYEEDAEYKRVQVLLRSGVTAWVYLYQPH
jgi:hypothetical protein